MYKVMFIHSLYVHGVGLLRRLKLFREQNEEDVTVLNYFDELEIHPLHISKSLLIMRGIEKGHSVTNVSFLRSL